ncbi:MAG: enoyl-CoA hydratase/isomerase family protein [Hyphomicrobiales bacterium]|nr:enoyl-CoA hydratase/isomerase family protein [Hyphomicrobiales bacterium]
MEERGGNVEVRLEERRGGLVARVTIDNRPKLNTLNSALMSRLVDALNALGGNGKLRAIVLTGAGERAFIGGADIDEMARLDPHTARAFITRVHECCAALRRLPVPVFARINGYALGAGMEVAAACDLRLAAKSASFGMPEVKLGIPSVVEAALLPMLVGWGRTRQMLLLGEMFTAEEARDWGFLERVVPDEELDAALDEWIGALLACGPKVIALQKRLILDWERLAPADAVNTGIEAFVEAWQTPEPKLAMDSFLAAKAARKRAKKSGA